MNRKNKTAQEVAAQQIAELTAANQRLQREIVEHRRVEAGMQAEIDRFQILADSAPAYIALINARTLHYEFVNIPFANAFNLPREKIIGSHLRDILGEENFQFTQEHLTAVRSGKIAHYENFFTTPADTGWVHVNYSPVFDEKGQVVSFIVLSWNITAQKQADERIKVLFAENLTLLKEMENLAITDPLTGAFNRRHFCEIGIRELARARRTGQPLSIIMFDLDHFKHINDTMGHSIGDEVLKTVVDSLIPVLRETDTLARLGGEEFYILMPDTDGTAAVLAAERFRALIANIDTVKVSNDTLHFTASFGVSQIDQEKTEFEELLKQVDSALYQAKAAGRNGVVRFQ